MKNVSIEIKVEILKIFVGCSKSRSGSWTDIRKFLKYYLDGIKNAYALATKLNQYGSTSWLVPSENG